MDVDIYRVVEQSDGSEYKTFLASTDQKKLLGDVFQTWMPKMHIMSVDAIKENIITSIALVRETIEWGKNATLSKRCNSISDYLAKGEYSKESLMNLVANTILSSDGYGLRV
jgi:hypothetical protein